MSLDLNYRKLDQEYRREQNKIRLVLQVVEESNQVIAWVSHSLYSEENKLELEQFEIKGFAPPVL